MKVAFCISGKGRVVSAILEAIEQGILNVTETVALLDRPTEFLAISDSYGVPTMVVEKSPGEDAQSYQHRLSHSIEMLNADVVFLNFNRLIQSSTVQMYASRMLNLHMSLLPLFPGFGALKSAIGSGMRIAGVTVHEVDAGIDTGPIVAQAAFPLLSNVNESKLGFELFKVAVPLSIQSLRALTGPNSDEKKVYSALLNQTDCIPSLYSPGIDVDILDFSKKYIANNF